MPNRIEEVVGIVMGMLCFSSPADAHDWFSGTNDSVTGLSCCGGSDCAPIPAFMMQAGVLKPTTAGMHVGMTVEQARYFNKRVSIPINDIVPWNRIQSAPVDGYAICLVASEAGRVRCLFGTGST